MRILLLILLAFIGCANGATYTAAVSPAKIISNPVESRSSGVGPLSVFFDATNTQSAISTRPFHDLQYTWNFGDVAGSPVGGTTWAYGTQPGVNLRNVAYGAVAAHVYEPVPGSGTSYYYPTVTITDGVNSTTVTLPTITVTDANTVFSGTNTVCVAAASLPVAGVGGCPSGAAVYQQASFATAVASYALTGKRVLFNKGDTFPSGATRAIVGYTGPGIIGSYGTGTNPVITGGTSDGMLSLSTRSTPNNSDWRVMDLTFDGQSLGHPGISDGSGQAGSVKQALFLRLSILNTFGGIILDPSILDYWNANGFAGQTIFDQIIIADTSITHQVGGAGATGIFIGANRYALLGSYIYDTTGIEHVTRYPYLNKAVISNTTMALQYLTKHVIKLHAPSWCYNPGSVPQTCFYSTDVMPTTGVLFTNGGIGYTQDVVISDNHITGTGQISVNIAQQNTSSDERIRDVVFERNWLDTSGANLQYAIQVTGTNISVRDNLIDFTNASAYRTGINPNNASATNPFIPTNVLSAYNNTMYASDTSSSGSPMTLVATSASTTNLLVKNNILNAPLAGGTPTITYGATGAGYSASNNTTSGNIKISTGTLFNSATPVNPIDFKITTGSYAIGAGTVVPVWSDFFNVTEPTPRDMGAVNH